ncbi:hypothetical protein COU16_01405 [Candidatus Kaiserbacteria bacterium CG10_big_fil_rev_8_21_14_0_10_47_16]|uniref:Bacterial sugar transferase domain-containing protein n=1 Tax=Candidatus Kaiserbacteria bacterium CG10_big_fil_rev_8_21_14_0_10_47_16 TaxID=1974608 RepID=A0A2H0UE67_9BACT|nr:MAG: hypothetical protein COU16_01405 [Candidatus Kaiserbacteria bacterium CG10_big_fil_rev_8_21_14_0_10_47_16]
MHTSLRGNTVLLLMGDFFTFLVSLVLTLAVRYREVPSTQIIDQHLAPFLILFVIWIGVFVIAGLYDRGIFLSRRQIPRLVLRTQFINIVIAALFFFILPFGIEPKTNLVIYLVISSVLIVFWRLTIFPFFATGKKLSVLVVGDSVEAQGVASVLTSNASFKNIRVFVLSRDQAAGNMQNALHTIASAHALDMIIADMREPHVAALAKDFYTLAFEDQSVQFYHLPTVYEGLHHRIPPSLVGEVWILEHMNMNAPRYAYDFGKRIIDIVGAFILGIPCIFIFPLVAVAVALDSKGPLFYKTQRIGQDGRPITLYKFRTKNGVDVGAAALHSTLVDTEVGKFLRKTRLDELPQLLNVIRGDLSFIGPRPEMPALAEVYAENIPYYSMRHRIKPGLSGWAQINHYDAPRAGVDIERTVTKLSFDLYYLKNRSLLLDLEIALKTIGTLLARSGS